MSDLETEAIFDMTPPDGAARIAYGEDHSQFGDLWLPQGETRVPVVVFFHGGYWRVRYGLTHASFACQALAARGLAVWNVEYRRVGNPGGGWPGTFDDVLSALRYLPRLANNLPLDLQRVVLCGHSAGGHLALWAAAQAARGRLAVPGLRGVVALAPVSDLHDAWERHLSQDAVVELLGGTPVAIADRYAAASPARLLPLGVPQVLIHGKADDVVPFAMSEDYVARAVVAGDSADVVSPPGCGHFELIDPGSPAWPQVVGCLRAMF